jgi:hypothetical protein
MSKEPPASVVAKPHGRLDFPAALLLIALAFFLWRSFDFFVPSFFGLADEHGYMTTAKRLATTGHFALQQTDPYAFIGETMMQCPYDYSSFYLRQPIGYPILCAIAYVGGGQSGPFLVNIFLALSLFAGVFVLGRKLNCPLAGALAALVLAMHPVILFYSIKPLSHIADMSAATWTIIAALAWREDRRMGRAALVGAALGMAILIRYTSILLVLPLVVILWDSRHELPRKKLVGHIAAAFGTACVALIGLLAYQWVAFGNPFHTGYTAGGNATSFSLAYLMDHAPAMLQCLVQPGTGLTLIFASALVGFVILAQRNRFLLALLVAWAVPVLLLNTAYYGKPRSNILLYARFALPAYVPILLLGLGWAGTIADRRRILRVVISMAAAVSIALSCFNGGLWGQAEMGLDPDIHTTLEHTRNLCRYVAWSADLAAKKAPPGSIILADNYTDYFLDYTDTYLVYTPNLFDPVKIQKRIDDLAQLPHEFDPSRTRQIKDLVGGKTISQLNDILRHQFEGYIAIGRPVFVLASDDKIPQWQQRLGMPMVQVAHQDALRISLYQVGPGR